MVRVLTSAKQGTISAADRVSFADAALAAAGHEVVDPALRSLVAQAARHEISGDQAIAAIRRHVQG
jgi:hypothetical protein